MIRNNSMSDIDSHATYLLTWNPKRFSWDDFQDDWESIYVGNRPHFRWSCGNTKKILVGDRVFLMRLGWQEPITGIVASGWVSGEPALDENWNEESDNPLALYINFEPDLMLNPHLHDLLDPTIISSNFNWRPQRSGVSIPDQIAFDLEQAWQTHIEKMDLYSQTVSSLEHLAEKSEVFREGSRILFSAYRYERDPRARKACILHYGLDCAVCGFNFSETYGQLGAEFIHVHHLLPLSERAVEYEINPIEDLRPVCPNCHAMLHRYNPPLSIEELKSVLQK